MTQYVRSFHGFLPDNSFTIKAGEPDATYRIEISPVSVWHEGATIALLDEKGTQFAEWTEKGIQHVALPDGPYVWKVTGLSGAHIQITENKHGQENLGHAPNPPATQASPFSQRRR